VLVSEQPEHLLALIAAAMDAREVSFQHQVKDQLGIPAIILLAAASCMAYIGGVADPDSVSKLFKQLLEPEAVAGRLDANYDLARELRIERAQIILLMIEFFDVNFSVVTRAISDGLKPRMEINSAI
jgi:hypothetical protein